MAGALSSLKIVEVGELVSAPYCSKLLADMGAEVVKVERPGTGDRARTRGPFPGDKANPETSGLFLYLNTNKRGVTLDITQREGFEIFEKLVAVKPDFLICEQSDGGAADRQAVLARAVLKQHAQHFHGHDRPPPGIVVSGIKR